MIPITPRNLNPSMGKLISFASNEKSKGNIVGSRGKSAKAIILSPFEKKLGKTLI